MEPVVGIDLGTFNSCVATMDGSTPQVIANRGGYKVTPSMVALTEAGKRLVGHIAKRQAVTNAENTVYAAKRLIGRKWDSEQVQNAQSTCPYRIVEGPHGDVRIQLRDKAFSLPEISAMILQELRLVAEEHLGQSVTQAVITVPAYFNDGQRQATKDAGAIAGLDVLRIINEPTAAALAYGFNRQLDQTIAVYDLGGGTFDISVLEISSNGVFRVISTAGDTFLGGEDFDHRIIDWLVEDFEKEHQIDLAQDRMALQRLKDAAERAKCELSSVQETEINLPFIISGANNEVLHLQSPINRAKLEGLTRDLVEQTVDICESTLRKAGMSREDIDEVILVGGMTRMPLVQQSVTEFFGKRANQGVHPDEVVAMGAAIQAAALTSEIDDAVLLDVTPHTLGIMVAGGYFESLIPQNTTVPVAKTKNFTTIRDNQTAVKILVLQGESEKADENELLGEFILTGLRRAAAGEVDIDVTFDINADGIVSVRAKDVETGIEQSITVTSTSGLTPDELNDMIAEASEHAVARRRDEEGERLAQELATLTAEARRMLPEVEAAVEGSDFGVEAVDKARAVVQRADAVHAKGDIAALRAEVESLERTLRMFRGVLGAG